MHMQLQTQRQEFPVWGEARNEKPDNSGRYFTFSFPFLFHVFFAFWGHNGGRSFVAHWELSILQQNIEEIEDIS